MPSKIDIISNALLLVGHTPISSLDADQGAGATVGSALYDTTLKYMLSTTTWRFSVKQRDLARLTATPLNTWKYAFQVPTDLITLYRVTPRCRYQIFEDNVFADVDALAIDYAYAVSAEALPEYFVQAFQYKLASDFAISITNDTQKNQLYEAKYREEVAIAMAADAKNHPPIPIVDSPFTDVRYGSGYFGDF